MSNLNDTLFGPLNQNYCLWFYILSVFGFVFLVLFLVPAIYMGIIKRKGSDYYVSVFGIAVIYAISYFQNRLLHTMCVNSIKV